VDFTLIFKKITQTQIESNTYKTSQGLVTGSIPVAEPPKRGCLFLLPAQRTCSELCLEFGIAARDNISENCTFSADCL
jgi:hypothetical protein